MTVSHVTSVVIAPVHVDDHASRLETAFTLVQAVVKANSQSNVKGQIWYFDPPWGPKTPERISIKLGIQNDVVGMTTYANSGNAATTWVVWVNTSLVTCFGIVVDPPFYVIHGITRRPIDRQNRQYMDRFWRPICRMTCFSARMCLLEFRWYVSPISHLGGQRSQNLKNWAWVGLFKPESPNIKIGVLLKL